MTKQQVETAVGGWLRDINDYLRTLREDMKSVHAAMFQFGRQQIESRRQHLASRNAITFNLKYGRK
jgi:hypothetical protein